MSIEQKRTGLRTIATMGIIVSFFALMSLLDFERGGHVASVQATSTATTTVTVLNTPPDWTLTARELYASATNTPTNAGTSTVFTAIATDNNSEDYLLLVCKSSSTPTHPYMPGSPTPQCGGGLSDQWGISATTSSAAEARLTLPVTALDDENNPWYAYICDINAGSPQCNNVMYNGLHEPGAPSATSSPFVVNHAATFTLAADDSPTAPGGTVTWTTTATDTIDVLRGGDGLQLFVCRAPGFNPEGPYCTNGGWATSTITTQGNPSTSTDLTIPAQDGDRPAYVYVVDEFGLEATGSWQASSTVLTVDNTPPYVSSSTITLYDVFGSTTLDTDLALTEPEGETQNFVVTFDVNDDNGCLNTSASNEVTDVDINVYRSAKGGALGLGCDSSGEYNANDCYTHTHPQWVPTCYQDPADSCTAGDGSVTWECTFPLWYIADPTDIGSVFAGQDWRVSARATDDGQEGVSPQTGDYSSDDEPVDGASEMTQFLSFRATGSPIAYGSFEPGFGNTEHPATTTVYATGNTGLDHYLSGDAMCVTYPTCSNDDSDTIYVPYQQYATSSSVVSYGSGFALSTSTSPQLVNVDILKTTATATPSSDDTYWGILVPSSITFAGDYVGRNYIDAAIAPSNEW